MDRKTTRRGNYESGSDYVLEYGELRFSFNEEDFSQRVEQAAVKLGFVDQGLSRFELDDLLDLAVSGEIAEPSSPLGEHINENWEDLVGPANRSLVHWIRRLVFRGAWLDQRVKEGELDVIFDEESQTFGYVQPDRSSELIELSREPSWRADRATGAEPPLRRRARPARAAAPQPPRARLAQLLAQPPGRVQLGLVAQRLLGRDRAALDVERRDDPGGGERRVEAEQDVLGGLDGGEGLIVLGAAEHGGDHGQRAGPLVLGLAPGAEHRLDCGGIPVGGPQPGQGVDQEDDVLAGLGTPLCPRHRQLGVADLVGGLEVRGGGGDLPLVAPGVATR